MPKKLYSYEERDFVIDWADKWFQLVSLIYDLIRFDKSPPPPLLPTELDEISYQSLRSWFIDHQLQFAPLWRDFYGSQDWDLHLVDGLIAEIHDAERCLENPFFVCYGPKDLYTLVQVFVLDVQSKEPSEHQAWASTMVLLSMDKIVVKFCDWIDERTPDSTG